MNSLGHGLWGQASGVQTSVLLVTGSVILGEFPSLCLSMPWFFVGLVGLTLTSISYDVRIKCVNTCL